MIILLVLFGSSARPIDFSPIVSGGIVVVPNWLPSGLVADLRDDARSIRARGLFRASGLRDNTVAPGAPQAYDERDRLICNITPGLLGNWVARDTFDSFLDQLRRELEVVLGRRGLRCNEQYFSIHTAGSHLKRHLDERHEATKGERAWMSDSRRSISWLVFLCEPGWGEQGGPGLGGELRAWRRPFHPAASSLQCGAHAGDIQLGWLEHTGTDGTARFEPLFLDSWVRAAGDCIAGAWTARSAIYRIVGGRREDLTRPFSADCETWPAPADGSGFGPEELEAAFRAQLPAPLQGRFRMTDTVDELSIPVEVSPLGGTLVLFDSVVVPHEVSPVLSGERYAMAGWFHELQQEQPAWFGVENLS